MGGGTGGGEGGGGPRSDSPPPIIPKSARSLFRDASRSRSLPPPTSPDAFGSPPPTSPFLPSTSPVPEKSRDLLDDAFDEAKASARTEAVERMTRLLRKHVALMDERGLTFEHTFRNPRLRFTVALARYGAKGREFVEVDSTGLDCDCAALRPRDELVAVDGVLLVDVHRPGFFRNLQRRVREGKRPITLKFVQGMHRDAAFAVQEETRLAKEEAFNTPPLDVAPLNLAVTRLDEDPLEDEEDGGDARAEPARRDCRADRCCFAF